jgi:hypothetical protein
MGRIVSIFVVAGAMLLATQAVAQNSGVTGDRTQSVDDGPHDRTANQSPNDIIANANRTAKPATASRAKDQARPAKPTEIIAGSIVKDSTGQQLGTIEGVEADGAILASGTGKVKVPLEAFGFNKSGLLLGVTKAQFDELVASANAPTKS